MTIQSNTDTSTLRGGTELAGDVSETFRRQGQVSAMPIDATLLSLDDGDLAELFRPAPAAWAREVDRLEVHHSQAGRQVPAELRRNIDRVRNALRGAMWTQQRWDDWKVD